nr:putative ribonuclease h protein [Quercus suber]
MSLNDREGVQVQPLIVTNSKEGEQTHSESRSKVDSQTGVEVESVHETRDQVEVQAPCLNSRPPVVQGEYLENQIEEIDRGLSYFDADTGAASTGTGLNVYIPHDQDVRSDVAPSLTLCVTNLNCFSTTNNSLVVSEDVSDSGSFSGGGKVVATRRRRVVRTVSDFVISNESGGTSVKRSSEENTLEELPRKRRVVSRKQKDGRVLSPVSVLTEEATMDQLIDRDSRWWNSAMVDLIFIPSEAQLIKSILVSLSAQRDLLVWPHSRTSMYQVRSGYHLLCESHGTEVASSSNTDGQRKFWNSLWKLNIPNKVKLFLWRACTDSIPTMLNLCKRKIVPSSACNLCHAGEESVLHALWSCEAVCLVWGSCFPALPSEFSRALWNRQNKMRVSEVVWPLNQVVGVARRHLQELQQSRSSHYSGESPDGKATEKSRAAAIVVEGRDGRRGGGEGGGGESKSRWISDFKVAETSIAVIVIPLHFNVGCGDFHQDGMCCYCRGLHINDNFDPP